MAASACVVEVAAAAAGIVPCAAVIASRWNKTQASSTSTAEHMSTSIARPSDGDVLLLVGTVKGAFIFSSNATRSNWTLHGPSFPGESVYALAYDERGG